MVLFNYSTKELTAKIVYYGPGLCGKTTNLQFIHGNLPTQVKGKMLSLATKTDRTLFFDFLPLDLGTIRGMKTRIQLYTVPGQVFYNETRKLVLKGADGIVFVADSQEQMLSANVESFRNLEDNLKGHGMRLADIPHVIQFNKRDLPRVASIDEMNTAVNKYNAPFYESVATTGIGVQDTLKAITKLVLLHLTSKYDPKRGLSRPGTTAAPVRPTANPAIPAPSHAGASPAPATAHDSQAARSIPLSSIEPPSVGRLAEPVPDPQRSEGGVPPTWPDSRPAPEFATSSAPNVDDLLDEVEDLREVGEEIDREGPPLAQEAVLRPFPEPTPDHANENGDSLAARSDHPPLSEWLPLEGERNSDRSGEDAPFPMAAAPVDTSPDRFEIDTSFDPGWTREALGGATTAETGTAAHGTQELLTPFPAPEEAPEDRAMDPETVDVADEPQDDAPIELTEVADDRTLFEDPLLDVARLAAGEAKEIVVPVEIGEGPAMRRFKLSVTLRLDPVG